MMGPLKGIRGEMNIITILMAIITGLGSFGTWTLFEGYNTAKREFQEMRDYREVTKIRLEHLETKNEDKWLEINGAIQALNNKFDLITEVKLRK